MHIRLITALAACALTTPTQAQTATALLSEGDLLGQFANQSVYSIRNLAVNASGGYACGIQSSGQDGGLSHFFGSLNGDPPGVLLTESTVGNLMQIWYYSDSFGLSDSGEFLYKAAIGPTFDDGSVWRDTTPLYLPLDSVPSLPGQLWEHFTGIHALANGEVAFRATTIDNPLSTTDGEHLFVGDTVVLSTMLPDTQGDVNISCVETPFRFSPSGEHYLAQVRAPAGNFSQTQVLMRSGSGLTLDGVVVHFGGPVPAAAGGVLNETWSRFDHLNIGDDGSYMFSAETDTDPLIDTVIVVDGVVRWREADLIDGNILRGDLDAAHRNRSGRVAFLWGVAGSNVFAGEPALFVGEDLVLRAGDAVDHDGDGMVDPEYTFTGIGDARSLVLAEDGTVFIIAEIDTPNGPIESLLRIDRSIGSSYCQSTNNSSGAAATIRATGSESVGHNDLQLRAQHLPPSVLGLFYFGTTPQQQPFGDGVRCVGGSIFRLPITAADASGTLVRAPDLTAPPSAGNVVGGTTWYYQGWFRDPVAMGSGFNLTDGLSIAFEP